MKNKRIDNKVRKKLREFFGALFADWTTTTLALAGLLAVIASYFSGLQQNKQTQRIEDLSAKNNQYVETISKAIETNTQLTDTNNSITAENLKLTEFLKSEITGGDSYIFLTTQFLNGMPEQFLLGFSGEHAMIDVRLSIHSREIEKNITSTEINKAGEVGGIKEIKGLWTKAMVDNRSWQRLPMLGENTVEPLNNIPTINKGDSHAYRYQVNSRNGVLNGYLFLHRDRTGKLHNIEYLKKNDVVLHEEPKNYPRDAVKTDEEYPDWAKILE